jgi:uncharacterized protein
MGVPIIVKIFISLMAILTVNRLSRNLPLAIVSATLILALWSGHSPQGIVIIAWERFFSKDNGFLLLVVTLVIWLSSLMDKTRIMRDLVTNIRFLLPPKMALAALPAVIGLLPMPGGALFSAPLVDDVDEKKELTPLEKTRINYWFRHIWEYTWPLFPGMILAADIAGLEIWQIFIVGIPLAGAMALAGYFFILRGVHISPSEGRRGEHHILKLLSPILIVIAVYAVIMVFFPAIHRISKYLPMVVGIFVAILTLALQRPVPAADWMKIIFSRRLLNMVFIVVLIRIYGAFIEARLPGGTLLMEQMRTELHQMGIPILLLMIIITFLSGFTTGISVGFVGAAFPIIFNLIGPDPTMWQLLGGLALAYPFGFSGTMLSPIHVCLIVTCEYFGSSLEKSIISLIPPSLVMMGVSLLISQLLLF